jgi:probable rRNA maturation factor
MILAIESTVECEGWSKLESLDVIVAQTLQAALEESGDVLPKGAEVSLLFCDDARIKELNRQFRGQDKPTNVLSFPGPDPLESAHFLGDIAIAYETVAREAEEQGKSLEHHCRHMGYDHEDDEEAEVMEATEIHILARLGVENPYRGEERKETIDDERV